MEVGCFYDWQPSGSCLSVPPRSSFSYRRAGFLNHKRIVTTSWYVGMSETLVRGTQINVIGLLFNGTEVILQWFTVQGNTVWCVVPEIQFHKYTAPI